MTKLGTVATVAAVTLLAPLRSARADVVVQLGGNASQFASQAGVDVATLQQQIQNQIETLFQTYRLHDYVRSFGDAQAFSSRGLGVDYGSTIGLLEIGVAGSVAMNGNKALIEGDARTQPLAGVAPNLTLMAGLNLGLLGLREVTLFGNYFKSSGSYREFSAHLENFGAHAQLKLFAPRHESVLSAFARWGGIAITTGFDRSRMSLSLGQNFKRSFPVVNGEKNVAQIDMDSMGTFGLDTRTWSIPLEVTTNLRFLYVVTVYGGAGFDWQLGGKSEMTAALNGTLTGTVSSQNTTADVGTVSVTANESADVTAGKVRGIVGLQTNLWFLKLFTQLNVIPNPFVASVAFGARLVW